MYKMNKKLTKAANMFVKKADEHSLVLSLNVYKIYRSRTNYTLYKNTCTYNAIFVICSQKKVRITLFLIIFLLVHMITSSQLQARGEFTSRLLQNHK